MFLLWKEDVERIELAIPNGMSWQTASSFSGSEALTFIGLTISAFPHTFFIHFTNEIYKVSDFNESKYVQSKCTFYTCCSTWLTSMCELFLLLYKFYISQYSTIETCSYTFPTLRLTPSYVHGHSTLIRIHQPPWMYRYKLGHEFQRLRIGDRPHRSRETARSKRDLFWLGICDSGSMVVSWTYHESLILCSLPGCHQWFWMHHRSAPWCCFLCRGKEVVASSKF